MKKWLRVSSIVFAALLVALAACAPAAPNPSAPGIDTPPPEPPAVSVPAETPPAPSAETSPTPPVVAPPQPPTDEEVEAFFDDAVFVGDSVTAGIEQYVRMARKDGPVLGGARFLSTTIGIKISDCAGDNGDKAVYYAYKGVEQPLEEIIAAMEVKRIFLMLGMNDLAEGVPVPDVMESYGRVLDKLEAAVPDIEIILSLNTPRTDSTWVADYTPNKRFFNSLIDEFVEAVREMCDARGGAYIDLNTPLKGGTNGLLPEYVRDGYLHLSDAGAAVAVEAYYEFAYGELTKP